MRTGSSHWKAEPCLGCHGVIAWQWAAAVTHREPGPHSDFVSLSGSRGDKQKSASPLSKDPSTLLLGPFTVSVIVTSQSSLFNPLWPRRTSRDPPIFRQFFMFYEQF
ncbi:uncharacterized protein LOC112588865 isoform X1 [Harpegnathos saltator]|uniref:uncharacterized protein LOC112588865 isoform X1 n=1 Tax=Harpegnathos saltator TaxID=610380 RepID=UPI000DBEF08D|nr:uncharacterized protein LOC112588865 isoform X1 [Harpegnathos saltator]